MSYCLEKKYGSLEKENLNIIKLWYLKWSLHGLKCCEDTSWTVLSVLLFEIGIFFSICFLILSLKKSNVKNFDSGSEEIWGGRRCKQSCLGEDNG